MPPPLVVPQSPQFFAPLALPLPSDVLAPPYLIVLVFAFAFVKLSAVHLFAPLSYVLHVLYYVLPGAIAALLAPAVPSLPHSSFHRILLLISLFPHPYHVFAHLQRLHRLLHYHIIASPHPLLPQLPQFVVVLPHMHFAQHIMLFPYLLHYA